MNFRNVYNKAINYIHNNYGTTKFFICGSFVDYFNGHFVEPKDIDIVIIKGVDDPDYPDAVVIIDVDGSDVVLDISVLTCSEILVEANRLEPKYLDMLHTHSSYGLYCLITNDIELKPKSEIRSAFSSFSSKAYNKGKKKLTLENDYDEYLGLKNIYHAFKFIINAQNRFVLNLHDEYFLKSKMINELYDIRCLIWNTYNSSTGTLEERWKVLDSVVKPLYNAYMTEFRINFPKG